MGKISRNQYIIAIGASAGGLESIAAFFDYTPLDAVSYILIQHLSADFKSQMADILARHSKLQIIEATDGVDVKANTVYLIPSAKFMAIKNGRLILSAKSDQPVPHKTIDYFFASLAEERGKKAIGIVLSGKGNDGSQGIEAIKSAGGMVIVQTPDSAAFNSMPLAAIATGCPDQVLTPQAMPQVIEEYVTNEGLFDVLTDHQEDEISEAEQAGIINLIKGNLPLDFTDYKRPTILRRIKRRMVFHHFSRISQYYTFLKDNPVEIELLANDFLISVTSFFRDKEAFKIIEKEVIPAIIDNKQPDEVVKIWVAGCATGEEAYSLAILAREHLVKTQKKLTVKIFATDINRAALDTASKGTYADSIKKTVSAERLEKYFSVEGTNFKIKREIREMLIFAHHDLNKNPPYCNVDLISCRNVLIYMNVALQNKVFSMLHFGLKTDGYLFLGPSENAAALKPDFIRINDKWNILKSNKTGRNIKFDALAPSVIGPMNTPRMEVSKNAASFGVTPAGTDSFNTTILGQAGITGVCTDDALQVISAFGDISFYLTNENFKLNLNDLLPGNIAIAFKVAAHRALKLNEKVLLEGMHFNNNTKAASYLVDVSIKPFNIPKSQQKLLLVLFTTNSGKNKEKNIIKNADINQLAREHLFDLENELAETKHGLFVANERIESSNENLQSFNEEVLSANEELQSSNEELQSVNEELQSINKQHQATNATLTELNDDMDNYFRSNANGQLFVDRDLLLKKYSPATVKHINIRESDIGRPLSNITTNIKFETLIADIKKVINDNGPVTREAESLDGKIYQVMTLPYLKKNSKTPDGAVISFFDITELKRLLRELDKKNEVLLRINDDLNNFVYGASHDLNAPILNIEGVMNILNEKLDLNDPDVITLSEMINSAIVNFKAVIKDLGKVGRIEAEMLNEQKYENFVTVFSEIMEAIDGNIKAVNAGFNTSFQVTEVRFAKKNLRSIMLNLITNALKFRCADRHPEITITTEKLDDFILLKVKDNGMGINERKLNQVFKMYQRLNEDIEGQGIGLYLMKKIVNAAGGKIEVDSEIGVGSTFKVFFKT